MAEKHTRATHVDAFHRLLRSWVRYWTGRSIGSISIPGTSRSAIYSWTSRNRIIDLRDLMAVIEACVPESLDQVEQKSWRLGQQKAWRENWTRVQQGLQPRPIDIPVPRLDGGPSSATVPNDFAFSSAEPPTAGTLLTMGEAIPILNQITDDAVRKVAAAHVVIAADKIPVGYHEQLPIGVYLDLHSASCEPEKREHLALFLAAKIRAALPQHRTRSIAFATPREGNVLVGSRVADLCGVPLLLVRNKRAPRFGFPIEGTFTVGMEVILIDDIVMGSLVARTASLLRKHGLIVTRCFSIFERTDADPRLYLDAAGVTLHSGWQIDDQLLSELRDAYTSGLT